jgi:hypothetical protein
MPLLDPGNRVSQPNGEHSYHDEKRPQTKLRQPPSTFYRSAIHARQFTTSAKKKPAASAPGGTPQATGSKRNPIDTTRHWPVVREVKRNRPMTGDAKADAKAVPRKLNDFSSNLDRE